MSFNIDIRFLGGLTPSQEIVFNHAAAHYRLMRFDTADLARLEAENSLEDVIIHEMGHVLGFGRLWSSELLNLIDNSGSNDQGFTGENAVREYQTLINDPSASSVPVAYTS